MAELDLGPEDISSIFPEIAEKKFKVTKEEQKEILEEALETKDSKIPLAFNPFGPSVFGQKLEEAKEQKIQNKMEYVSEIIGAPVQNVGFSNYKDLFLTFDLSRSNYFKNRQKKFMKYYPKGEYQRVSVDYGDGNTEKLELFKYDKDDDFYKVANPYGRDFGEIGRVAGTILDEAFGLDVAALGSPELLKRISESVRVGAPEFYNVFSSTIW